MEKHDLKKNAAVVGQIFRDGLLALQRKYPRIIGDVRGKGLMVGVEFVADETTQDRTPNPKALARLFEETKVRGLLIGKGGLYGNVARISPPLIASAEDVAEALSILDESLKAMEAA
jgi:4-aminobutyrate aminotransferase-like enzyme